MANISTPVPSLSVDDTGRIIWTPAKVLYNPDVWHRGKTVTNEEFNNLFVQQVTQGNYHADTLTAVFKNTLPTAVQRIFSNYYKLHLSYTKVFTPEDWSAADENGYYYIQIPKEEHKINPVVDAEHEGFTIDITLYLLKDGQFYQVHQANVTEDNLVTIYTDDNTISGCIVIRPNDRSYNISAAVITADQVEGLSTLAKTGSYKDLQFGDDESWPTQIENNKARIDSLFNEESPTAVLVAEYAKTLDSESTISNIKISDIFETGSNYVKNATHADNAVLNADGTYSGLTRDANGVLKLGNLIIPQKQLISSTTKSGTSVEISTAASTTDKYEITFDLLGKETIEVTVGDSVLLERLPDIGSTEKYYIGIQASTKNIKIEFYRYADETRRSVTGSVYKVYRIIQ